MEAHHRAAIQRLQEHYEEDPNFPALIAGGSIMKGLARPDSDVDVIFVATDEEYARRRAAGDLVFLSLDFTDYDGGYIDGKIVSLDFLKDVAARGSEPARWAFVGAEVVYTRIPEVHDLLRTIVLYPENLVKQKAASFFAQVLMLRWFIGEAEKRQDRYLLMRSAADMVLFASRLVLVCNRILFPSHKWLMREVRRAPHKPSEFCDLVDELLQRPCEGTAERLQVAVMSYYDPDLTWPQTATRFIQDREWNWREGTPPIEDW